MEANQTMPLAVTALLVPAALAALLLTAGAFGEGPADEDAPRTEPPCAFGWCMGHAIDEEPEGRNADGLNYVSMEHDLFGGGVTAYWTPATGVCMVKGLYTVPSPDDYGKAHRSAFNHLSDLVKRKYGEPSHTFDHLGYGSTWNEPRDWLMGLKKDERALTSFWSEKPSILPAGLEGVRVDAKASGLLITYRFANFLNCIEEGKASLADDF